MGEKTGAQAVRGGKKNGRRGGSNIKPSAFAVIIPKDDRGFESLRLRPKYDMPFALWLCHGAVGLQAHWHHDLNQSPGGGCGLLLTPMHGSPY